MYDLVLSGRYKTALKRLSRHKDFDQLALEHVVKLLSHDKFLAPRYRDHELKGEFTGIRECHIKNDILLLYRKEKKVLVLLLVDLGSHSQLFGK
jgi:mRNA interferase YafQ